MLFHFILLFIFLFYFIILIYYFILISTLFIYFISLLFIFIFIFFFSPTFLHRVCWSLPITAACRASDSGFWLGLIGAIQIGLVLYCICIVQPVAGLIMYTRLARLDDGLHESSMLNSYNRSHNRLVQPQNVCIHDATGCTTGYIVWMGCYTTDWECKLHGPLISYIMYSVTVFKIKVADDASVLRSDWKRDKNSSRI